MKKLRDFFLPWHLPEDRYPLPESAGFWPGLVAAVLLVLLCILLNNL